MNNGWRTKKSTLLSDISVLALAGGFATTAALAGSAFAVGLFKPVTTAAPAMIAQPACAPDAMGCRNVKVTVQGNQISLDPATVTVTPRSPPVKIVWYLATPGYRFVDLANDRPVNFAAQYFMSNDPRFCYPWTSDTVYVCTDWNADPFPWGTDYTLKVQAISGGSSPPPVTGRVVNN